MASPGDTVYQLTSINIDLNNKRCDILVKYGVVDEGGNPNYRNRRVTLTIDDTRAGNIGAIIAALFAANLPDFLAGAVPA